MINSVYEELELTPKLIQFGVKKIVRQGNKALGYSMMVVVNWHDVDRAFRFDVEKKWKKTIENYDREIMGIGFHDTLKAEIRMFMVEKSAELSVMTVARPQNMRSQKRGRKGVLKKCLLAKQHIHTLAELC